jgi:hypothetical protein
VVKEEIPDTVALDRTSQAAIDPVRGTKELPYVLSKESTVANTRKLQALGQRNSRDHGSRPADFRDHRSRPIKSDSMIQFWQLPAFSVREPSLDRGCVDDIQRGAELAKTGKLLCCGGEIVASSVGEFAGRQELKDYFIVVLKSTRHSLEAFLQPVIAVSLKRLKILQA